MGQKINTNSLLTGSRLSWRSTWCDNNSFFVNSLLKDFEVRNYNRSLLKACNILTNTAVLHRANNVNGLYNKVLKQRYITLQPNLNNLNDSKILQKTSIPNYSPINLNQASNVYSYQESDKNKSFIAKFSPLDRKSTSYFLTAQCLSDYINQQIEFSAKRKDIIFRASLLRGFTEVIKHWLNKSNYTLISGIKIECKGKWTRTKSGRANKVAITFGKITPDGVNSLVSYGVTSSSTKHGAFSVNTLISYNFNPPRL